MGVFLNLDTSVLSNHQELVVQHASRVQKIFRVEFYRKLQNIVKQVK